jgi:hypothetical protein
MEREDDVAVLGADEWCVQCGHSWNDHKLLTDKDPPLEGWMECPMEGCTCKFTWNLGSGDTAVNANKAVEYVLKNNEDLHRRLT